MKRLVGLLLLVVSLISACAQAPKTASKIELGSKAKLWLDHQIAVGAIHSWNMKGRIAVKNEKKSATVTLFWDQFFSNYQLRFVAPLGQGAYILTGSPGGVVIKAPKDKTYMAEEAKKLLREELGWDVRLNGFKYWVRGLPEPDIKYSKLLLDEKGRLINMEQSGFDISISSYTEQGGVSLPEKLAIKRDAIQLKAIIQNWEF